MGWMSRRWGPKRIAMGEDRPDALTHFGAVVHYRLLSCLKTQLEPRWDLAVPATAVWVC